MKTYYPKTLACLSKISPKLAEILENNEVPLDKITEDRANNPIAVKEAARQAQRRK